MLDVDHFKKLNDNYWHGAGDQVLKDVAKTIIQAVGNWCELLDVTVEKSSASLLPAMPVEDAVQIAEKVRVAICEQLAEPYHVTASFGVSSSSFCAPLAFQAMLEQRTSACTRQEHGGRNAVRCAGRLIKPLNWPQRTINALPNFAFDRTPISLFPIMQSRHCTRPWLTVMLIRPCIVNVWLK